jgi:ribosomal protein L11 methyltransferase
VSDVFYDFGLQGVVVEDSDRDPVMDWAEDAVARPSHDAVIGYLSRNRTTETKCKTLEDKLARLQKEINLFYRVSYKEIDEEDWTESWKAYFWPQKIGSNIVVKPTWREYQAEPEEIIIELDPGMAFGTGTHPTTSLCIRMIEKHLRQGDSFLDVGTGSGILMIAAAKLGAARVCGSDNDDVAVEVAQKNLALNTVDPQKLSLTLGNLVDGIKAKYDFVTANILTNIIVDLLDNIENVLERSAIFTCSGVIDEKKHLVIEKMKDIGFEILEVAREEEWVAITGRLRQSA